MKPMPAVVAGVVGVVADLEEAVVEEVLALQGEAADLAADMLVAVVVAVPVAVVPVPASVVAVPTAAVVVALHRAGVLAAEIGLR